MSFDVRKKLVANDASLRRANRSPLLKTNKRQRDPIGICARGSHSANKISLKGSRTDSWCLPRALVNDTILIFSRIELLRSGCICDVCSTFLSNRTARPPVRSSLESRLSTRPHTRPFEPSPNSACLVVYKRGLVNCSLRLPANSSSRIPHRLLTSLSKSTAFPKFFFFFFLSLSSCLLHRFFCLLHQSSLRRLVDHLFSLPFGTGLSLFQSQFCFVCIVV